MIPRENIFELRYRYFQLFEVEHHKGYRHTRSKNHARRNKNASSCKLIKVELIPGDPRWERIRKRHLCWEHQCCRVSCFLDDESIGMWHGDRIVRVNDRWGHGLDLEDELKQGSRAPSMPITLWVLRRISVTTRQAYL